MSDWENVFEVMSKIIDFQRKVEFKNAVQSFQLSL